MVSSGEAASSGGAGPGESVTGAESMQSNGGEGLVAIFDFDPTDIKWTFEDHAPLALSIGDAVELLDLDDDEVAKDWALGFLVAQPEARGLFPRKYVGTRQQIASSETASEVAEYELAPETPCARGRILTATFDFGPSSVGDSWPFHDQPPLSIGAGEQIEVLSHSKGEDWIFGQVVGHPARRGFVPRVYLDVPGTSSDAQPSPTGTMGRTFSILSMEEAVAMFDFDPSQMDWPYDQDRPLPLSTGDRIQVLRRNTGENWALVQVVGDPDRKGLVPKTYVAPTGEGSDQIFPQASVASFQSCQEVVAIYDFDPADMEWPFDDERPLALSAGDRIQVLRRNTGEDWALGQVVGEPSRKGLVPKNRIAAQTASEVGSPMATSFSLLSAKEVVAMHDFDPSQLAWPFKDEPPLSFSAGDRIRVLQGYSGEEWALGSIVGADDRKGLIPKVFVTLASDLSEHGASTSERGVLTPDNRLSEADKQLSAAPASSQATTEVVALFNFDPSSLDWTFDEWQPLALTEGDHIVVTSGNKALPEGWSLGHRSAAPQTAGLFPSAYVRSLQSIKDMLGSEPGGEEVATSEPKATLEQSKSEVTSPTSGAQREAMTAAQGRSGPLVEEVAHSAGDELPRKESLPRKDAKSKAVRFIVDNRYLLSDAQGVLCRKSKVYDDLCEDAGAPWGSIVEGFDEGDGWLELTGTGAGSFLPFVVDGERVLLSAPTAASTTEEQVANSEFVADNSKLCSSCKGILHRLSKRMVDVDETGTPWGAIVKGKDSQDGWLELPDGHFMPFSVSGITVLVPKPESEEELSRLLQTATAVPPSGVEARCVALHDFSPGTVDWPFSEALLLVVSAGDRLRLPPSGPLGDAVPEGWVYGHRIDDASAEGYFPLSCVGKLEQATSPQEGQQLPDHSRPLSRFMLDNSRLHSLSKGVVHRRDKHLDADCLDEGTPWGGMVEGHDAGDGWFELTDGGFIPFKINDKLILLPLPQEDSKPPTAKQPTAKFIVDNRRLQSQCQGVVHRKSKNYGDVCPEEGMPWGSIVEGVDSGDGWLELLDGTFLPFSVSDALILFPVSAKEEPGLPDDEPAATPEAAVAPVAEVLRPDSAASRLSSVGSDVVVALFDFEPGAMDWPFEDRRPLALSAGDLVQVVRDSDDETGDWCFGHLLHRPESRGFFPKSYTGSRREVRASRTSVGGSDLGLTSDGAVLFALEPPATAVALFDFDSSELSPPSALDFPMLSFTAGDEVQLMVPPRDEEPQWCFGCLVRSPGSGGYFPKSYIGARSHIIHASATVASEAEVLSANPSEDRPASPQSGRGRRWADYMVDNSELQADSKGVLHRLSKREDDICPDNGSAWGSIARGIDLGDGWLLLPTGLYLPFEIDGVVVLRPASFDLVEEDSAPPPLSAGAADAATDAATDAAAPASGAVAAPALAPTPPTPAPKEEAVPPAEEEEDSAPPPPSAGAATDAAAPAPGALAAAALAPTPPTLAPKEEAVPPAEEEAAPSPMAASAVCTAASPQASPSRAVAQAAAEAAMAAAADFEPSSPMAATTAPCSPVAATTSATTKRRTPEGLPCATAQPVEQPAAEEAAERVERQPQAQQREPQEQALEQPPEVPLPAEEVQASPSASSTGGLASGHLASRQGSKAHRSGSKASSRQGSKALDDDDDTQKEADERDDMSWEDDLSRDANEFWMRQDAERILEATAKAVEGARLAREARRAFVEAMGEAQEDAEVTVKLTILVKSASGLSVRSGADARLYCLCRVPSRPATEGKAKPVESEASAQWDWTHKIPDYASGDPLEIVIRDAGDKERILGRALLQSDQFFPEGLEVTSLDLTNSVPGATGSLELSVIVPDDFLAPQEPCRGPAGGRMGAGRALAGGAAVAVANPTSPGSPDCLSPLSPSAVWSTSEKRRPGETKEQAEKRRVKELLKSAMWEAEKKARQLAAQRDKEEAERLNQQPVTLHVRLSGGTQRPYKVKVKAGNTLAEVGAVVTRKASLALRPRLLYAGKYVDTAQTLLEAGIETGAEIVAEPAEAVLTTSRDGTAKVWNVETGSCELSLEGHKDGVNSAIFAPNSKSIVTASDDATVKVWSVDLGECLYTFKGHRGPVLSAVFSDDSNKLVSTSEDGTAKVWSLKSGSLEKTLNHGRPVLSASFTPDMTGVKTHGQDGKVKLWNMKTGHCDRTMLGQTQDSYISAFSNDGKFFAMPSGETYAKICEIGSGDVVKELWGHEDVVLSVTFPPLAS